MIHQLVYTVAEFNIAFFLLYKIPFICLFATSTHISASLFFVHAVIACTYWIKRPRHITASLFLRFIISTPSTKKKNQHSSIFCKRTGNKTSRRSSCISPKGKHNLFNTFRYVLNFFIVLLIFNLSPRAYASSLLPLPSSLSLDKLRRRSCRVTAHQRSCIYPLKPAHWDPRQR